MTSADGSIDIMQDFASLYAREQMLAFFDFTIARSGAASVSGLCRVSKPKDPGAGSHYLSLTFVVDTPDADARTAAQTALDQIMAEPLRRALPEVREVVAVPSINSLPESCVIQIDLLMHADPSLPFIAAQLVPAIGRLAGLTLVDFVRWDNPAAATPKSAAPVPAAATDSLAGRLSRYLKEQLGLE